MIFWTQRTSLTRRQERVWEEITASAMERPWPSISFFTLLICPAILWIVSYTNIEADRPSAALKFSSESHCSNANSYQLKIWLLLETSASEIFSDSFLVSSGHQKKYYKYLCIRVDRCANQHKRRKQNNLPGPNSRRQLNIQVSWAKPTHVLGPTLYVDYSGYHQILE